LYSCKDIGTESSRLLKDLEIECDSSEHQNWVYGCAVPAIIFWGLGIPLSAFLFLRSVRKKLHLYSAKSKFGFMYNGYERQSYYWELIIMLRKIILVFIAVFLRSIGIFVQALVVLLFTLICLYLNMRRKPFMTLVLNKMESLSLLTCAVTLYCGICFVSARGDSGFEMNEYWKWLFFLTIVMVNVIFLLFWLYQMSMTFRKALLITNKKVYAVLFLCCKKKKLNRHTAHMNISETHQAFNDSLLSCIKK
jgi:hypothetical protein